MQASIDAAWQQLDIADLSNSLAAYTQAVYAVTHWFGQASAALAVRSYLADRAAAGVASSFTPRPAPLPVAAQVTKTVDWAVGPLFSDTPDVPTAQTNIQGSIGRLVQNVGRQTVIDSVHADKKAKGWARIPETGCCSFCALLSTRGMAYRSETTASFKSHDHCRCHPEPVFNAYEPSAQVREWQALYRQSTAGVHGMKNLQNAFRRAFEAPADSAS